MKCKMLVRRGHTSILSREDTLQSWSGEDTPRSYVRKDSWHTSILCQERTVNTPQSWSGEDTPRSYVRNDSWHTSILCQERTVNTPQSWSGEDTYISGEGLDLVLAWERNTLIPNDNGPSGVQDSKPPRYSEGEGKRRRWLWRKFVGNKVVSQSGNKGTRRNVNKLKGVSVVE